MLGLSSTTFCKEFATNKEWRILSRATNGLGLPARPVCLNERLVRLLEPLATLVLVVTFYQLYRV